MKTVTTVHNVIKLKKDVWCTNHLNAQREELQWPEKQ